MDALRHALDRRLGRLTFLLAPRTTMDAAAAACWAVYLDDRVDCERWIDRDGEQLHESAELAANLARILAICRQGKYSYYSSYPYSYF